MKEFKICLIGCGQMTKDGHGLSCQKYANEHEGVVLAACCDINLEAAEFACKEYGFQRAYTDYLEMVEQEIRGEITMDEILERLKEKYNNIK